MKTIIVSNPEYPWAQSLAQHLAESGVPADAVPIYKGRNTVYRLDWQGHDVCIKTFKKPIAINAVAYTTVRKSKAARSYLSALRLLQMGINTPAPLAYVEERCCICLCRSYYVCAYLEADNIRNWHLLDDQEALLTALASEMVKLHRAGVWHKDFSPGNILVQRPAPGQYTFHLVDINRMKFGVHDDRLMQNFKCIHLDENETVRLARLYAHAADRDEQELTNIARQQLSSYKNHKRRLASLKRFLKGEKQKTYNQEPEQITTERADVVVVVPIYKPTLSEKERISLDSITKQLQTRRIVAVCPQNLDLSAILKDYPMLEVEMFDASMFDGIRGYNRLMTSSEFYDRFLDHEYMLVAQLDTFIFVDELDQWCAKGYDYVGAPWLERPINKLWPIKWIKQFKDKRKLSKGDYSRIALYDKVGNGGLSLRKVAKFAETATKHSDLLAQLNQQGKKGYPEDVFWATRVEDFVYPTAIEALHFAFDKYPRYSYKLTGKALPMGCHAWYSRKMRRFWLPIIDKMSNYSNQ